MFGIDDCPLWRDHLNWAHQAGTRRHVIALEQTAKHVGNGRDSDRFHRIDWAGNLRRAAAEVNASTLSFNFDADPDGNFSIAYAIIIKRIFSAVFAVRDRTNSVTHEPRGVFDQMCRIVGSLASSATLDDFQKACAASF